MKSLTTIFLLGLIISISSCLQKDVDYDFPPLDGEDTDYSEMFTTEKLGDVGKFIPVNDTKWGQVTDIHGSLFSQWRTVPNLLGGDQVGVQWGAPGKPGEGFAQQMGTEVWHVKYDCASGHNYIYIDGYGDNDGNILWGIRTTKAIFVNLNSGKEFDITYGGNCDQGGGQPYMIYDLYDEPYKIKVWHDITNPETGATVKRVYWEQTVTPFVEIENPFWEGEDTKIRMTIHQEEAWWDSEHGWQGIATGDMEDVQNPIEGGEQEGYQEPTGENVVYSHDQWWAEGVDGDKSGWYAWKLYDRANNHEGYLKYGWKY